jgi:cytochrome c-type biogenesis protein CcmH/NrfG
MAAKRILSRWPLLLLLALAGCASSSARHDPAPVLTLERQAAEAYDQGDLAQALVRYRELLRELPDDDGVWFRLGNVYARLDQPQDAIEAYRHVLQHDGGNAKAWHNMGVMLMRQAQAALARSAQAADHDPSLRDDSLALAEGLARLSRPAGGKGKAAAASGGTGGAGATP